ncbi:MAG TPA: rRNA maturation RNase YbeY [Bacteroidales bacterium]|nr:rRNA maturation RNase YbeY [Bacteroidales bacterium]
MSIRIFYDEVSYRYKGWLKLKGLLKQIITNSENRPGELSIILTGDTTLKGINVQFLEHDYFTDVITFNYNEDNIINGEIYISIDTVRNNAQNYDVSLYNELTRVIIHGVLHLTGYNDKSEEERKLMRDQEDRWLETGKEKYGLRI